MGRRATKQQRCNIMSGVSLNTVADDDDNWIPPSSREDEEEAEEDVVDDDDDDETRYDLAYAQVISIHSISVDVLTSSSPVGCWL
jgi:hypothetical protein